MAFQDPQYQINDLKAQLRVLQNQLRSQQPQTAKASPIAPLTNATSGGQTVAGVGMSQDAFSRAATTAVQSAISGVEALQYVQTQGTTFDLSVSTAYTLRTEFLRPDPVVGQVYRATMGGNFFRGAGAAYAATVTVGVTGGSSAQLFGIIPTGSYTFMLQVVLVTIVAGTSAQMQVNSVESQGPSAGGGPITTNATQLNDALLAGVIAGNLTGGSINFSVTTSALSAGASLNIDCYILESLGFRTG